MFMVFPRRWRGGGAKRRAGDFQARRAQYEETPKATTMYGDG